jgi:hypothetical protein
VDVLEVGTVLTGVDLTVVEATGVVVEEAVVVEGTNGMKEVLLEAGVEAVSADDAGGGEAGADEATEAGGTTAVAVEAGTEAADEAGVGVAVTQEKTVTVTVSATMALVERRGKRSCDGAEGVRTYHERIVHASP